MKIASNPLKIKEKPPVASNRNRRLICAPGGTRTHTVQILRLSPLPIGIPGHSSNRNNDSRKYTHSLDILQAGVPFSVLRVFCMKIRIKYMRNTDYEMYAIQITNQELQVTTWAE